MMDYHVHSNYTEDAEGSIEDYCKSAEEKDIKEIAFTNHLIVKNVLPSQKFKAEKIPEYIEDIESNRERFNVKIKAGLEVDYWKSEHKIIEDILNRHPFDFILGTVHFIDGHLISGTKEDASEFFKNKTMLEIYRAYFIRVIETVESQLFDVLAHPDYIRKNVVRYFGQELPFEEYRKDVEKVVEALVDNKVGIEINTCGYHHGIGDFFPSLEFLKLCIENGVKVVTIGSDAHTPSRVGDRFEEAAERLKKLGRREIFSFDKRKPKEMPL